MLCTTNSLIMARTRADLPVPCIPAKKRIDDMIAQMI